ncbi:hypothetical protein HDV00_012486 [Rhizophlyctis rosea]|nr:hypothetical protein HDV00_012486 [Rhizophlyctis rosea]
MAQAPAFPPQCKLWEREPPFTRKPFPPANAAPVGKGPTHTVDAYCDNIDVPLQTSTLQPPHTGRATYGYNQDHIEGTVTTDIAQANRLFHSKFYDNNGVPRFSRCGFDIEPRGSPGYLMPALIQAVNEVGEGVVFHCPTLSARQYPDWLLFLIADPNIHKWGFGPQNDVVMLRNVGVTEIEGFMRCDDIVLSHQKAVLGNLPNHTGANIKMHDAAQINLGVPKGKGAKKWERAHLTDPMVEYALTDAQQSVQIPKQVEALMSPVQIAEAYKFARMNSHWLWSQR